MNNKGYVKKMNKEFMITSVDEFELPLASYHTLTGLCEILNKNGVVDLSINAFRMALQRGTQIKLLDGKSANVIKVEF